MDKIFRFHVADNIFWYLDSFSLTKCRAVCKQWKAYIDCQKFVRIENIRHQVDQYHGDLDEWDYFLYKCPDLIGYTEVGKLHM